MKIRSKKTSGFTLIELMITVAIVGILAGIAMPAYQDYVIRGQVSEAFTEYEGMKTAAIEYHATSGNWPSQLSDLGLNTFPAGKYSNFEPSSTNDNGTVVDDGSIIVIFGNANLNPIAAANVNAKIKGGTVTFKPVDDGNGNYHWSCTPDGKIILQKYVPSSCTPT